MWREGYRPSLADAIRQKRFNKAVLVGRKLLAPYGTGWREPAREHEKVLAFLQALVANRTPESRALALAVNAWLGKAIPGSRLHQATQRQRTGLARFLDESPAWRPQLEAWADEVLVTVEPRSELLDRVPIRDADLWLLE